MNTFFKTTFEIEIPFFKGPFDLLLFFIERDELDIHDIPISKITNDFLEYLHHLEQIDMEIASDFILVAATLMNIKSKMLLPPVINEETQEEIDPREDIVKQLIEYKKYKSMLPYFIKMEEERSMRKQRGNIHEEQQDILEKNNWEIELQNVNLYLLLKTYIKVMDRLKETTEPHKYTILEFPYTIESQKKYLLDTLHPKKRYAFIDLIQEKPVKIYIIFTFLAILELLTLQSITIFTGEGFNNFWIELKHE
ncbi:MAG: segregation/condensation protein A [Chitinophagaceae bacterium]|nr:segregation/condensation protein A [Chitinophagaceae bacterium]